MTFIAIGPFAWGKSEVSTVEALRNVRRHVPRSLLNKGKHPIRVYEVENFLSVDGLGRIEYKGKKPKLVAESSVIKREDG